MARSEMSSYEDLYEYIVGWVGRQNLGGAEVVPDATLSNLGLDSLAMVDLAYELKRECGITVPLEELDGVDTVDGVVTVAVQSAGKLAE